MTKVLMAISEWGYWGEELVGPLDACDRAGYAVEFVTPTGKRPTPLAVSMSTDFVDPPQGKCVTEQGMAARTRELDASHRLDKPVAAVCYGVATLAFARDPLRKQSLIRGKRVTGHPIDYDYHDGTGFEGPHALDGSNAGFGEGYINFGAPFYPLEFILRDAVGPDGEFIGNVGHAESVVVDYPFITARSTESSVGCGRALVDVLDNGLRRYGW